jgi:hypothetical protein
METTWVEVDTLATLSATCTNWIARSFDRIPTLCDAKTSIQNKSTKNEARLLFARCHNGRCPFTAATLEISLVAAQEIRHDPTTTTTAITWHHVLVDHMLIKRVGVRMGGSGVILLLRLARLLWLLSVDPTGLNNSATAHTSRNARRRWQLIYRCTATASLNGAANPFSSFNLLRFASLLTAYAFRQEVSRVVRLFDKTYSTAETIAKPVPSL